MNKELEEFLGDDEEDEEAGELLFVNEGSTDGDDFGNEYGETEDYNEDYEGDEEPAIARSKKRKYFDEDSEEKDEFAQQLEDELGKLDDKVTS